MKPANEVVGYDDHVIFEDCQGHYLLSALRPYICRPALLREMIPRDCSVLDC